VQPHCGLLLFEFLQLALVGSDQVLKIILT
jgi:hypothetical protein